MKIKLLQYLFLALLISSCEKTMPPAPEENELLDGPVEGLSAEQQRQFLNGDIAFNDEIFTAATGLGPLFNANSCGSCHAGDGKGHPFIAFKRFGQIDSTGNQYLHLGGPQLQNKAVPGYQPEELPSGATYSILLAPAVTGLGFLDAVSDETILDMADPDDADGDGISGVPNWTSVPDYVVLRPNAISQNGKYISRFGKKGAVYDLLQQTAAAYNEDMGVTSVFEPFDTYSGLEIDPEIATQTVNVVVSYLKTLKAPLRRDENEPDVLAGENIFIDINCSACHKPTLKSGDSPIEAISNKEFYPFTDLLLHDMGAGLDDGYTEGSAKTYEWRTPPLWGLGLSKDSQGGSYFLMHDGRATSIEEAILLHGGEALASKNAYTQLTETEKQQLLQFLESL